MQETLFLSRMILWGPVLLLQTTGLLGRASKTPYPLLIALYLGYALCLRAVRRRRRVFIACAAAFLLLHAASGAFMFAVCASIGAR